MGGRTIAEQYGGARGRKQQMFGRVDPFCAFAVLPLLIVAGIFLWGGIALGGVGLIVLAILIVVIDSWANRPVREPRYREDY